MLRTCSVFASSLFFALIAFAPPSGASVGDARSYAALGVTPDATLHRSRYPDDVECKNFDKTGYRTWQLRDRSTIDLGNWDAAFPIAGAIEPVLSSATAWTSSTCWRSSAVSARNDRS